MEPRGTSSYGYNTPTEFSEPKFQISNEAVNPTFDLSYRNEGFRDNSTFVSRENSLWQSTAGSEVGADGSPSEGGDYLTKSATLPLNRNFGMDRPEYGSEATFQAATPEPFYDQRERLREVSESYYDPKSGGSFYKDSPEPLYQQADPMGLHDRPQSHLLLETNLDSTANENGLPTPPHPPSRSKSEALLETNLDSYLPSTSQHSQPFAITAASRSKSQPLETAM